MTHNYYYLYLIGLDNSSLRVGVESIFQPQFLGNYQTMSFTDELTKKLETEYEDLQPAVLGILKKGMKEGEKKTEEGEGIDKIQLDSANAASYITQYYIEQLVGKPLSRAEISGKNGSPLSVKLNFVLSEEPNVNGTPIRNEINTSDESNEPGEDSPNT